MILVDTSVWIDHLHRAEVALSEMLQESKVCTHPMVIGELALGSLRDRTEVLGLLSGLPRAASPTADEVLSFVELHTLYGTGLSLVDAYLLAAVRLTPGDRLWTRDRRLYLTAGRLGVSTDLAV